MIELCRGKVLFREILSAIESYLGSAIIAHDPVACIVGIDPHVVVVAMVIGYSCPGYTPVDGAEKAYIQHIQGIHAFWICKELAEIPGPLGQVIHGAHATPGIPAVCGMVNAILFILHDGPDLIVVNG